MQDFGLMGDYTNYYDLDGNQLTHAELKKILRKNVSYQQKWWKAKVQPKVGNCKPPPGVRQNRNIKAL